jgi:archaellum component FlaG (FlaF/FlaG flagellin family)
MGILLCANENASSWSFRSIAAGVLAAGSNWGGSQMTSLSGGAGVADWVAAGVGVSPGAVGVEVCVETRLSVGRENILVEQLSRHTDKMITTGMNERK